MCKTEFQRIEQLQDNLVSKKLIGMAVNEEAMETVDEIVQKQWDGWFNCSDCKQKQQNLKETMGKMPAAIMEYINSDQ